MDIEYKDYTSTGIIRHFEENRGSGGTDDILATEIQRGSTLSNVHDL